MNFPLLIWNALVIIGVWEATGQGMILEKPANWLRGKLGDYWCKPLFLCPVCCASVWGLAFYFFRSFCQPLWYVLALAGIVKRIVKLAFNRVY